MSTPQRFVYSSAIKGLVSVALMLSIGGAVVLYRLKGWTALSIAAVLVALVAIAGLLDVLTARVILNAESIVVVQNLRRREYPRSAFTKVTWAKGVPVALQKKEGAWVRLPSVGKGSQALANTIRAWIRR